RNANLTSTVLDQVDLTQAQMQRAVMPEATAIECDLSGATLTNADLAYLRARDCGMSRANFDGARLTKGELIRCDLTAASLVGSECVCSYRLDYQFASVNLGGGNLAYSVLSKTDFGKTIVDQSDFEGARFIEGRLSDLIGSPRNAVFLKA